jgi:protein involved in polysaccharide export with SLBB domain
MMSRFILAIAVTVLSLAPASAQIKSGTQPKDLLGASGSVPAARRPRVLRADEASPSKARPSLADTSASLSLNHGSQVDAVPAAGDTAANNSMDASSRTRLRTSAAASAPAAAPAVALSQIYRVGVGDVLDVQLLGVPASRSTLFTVLAGGVLDYPLSSSPVPVAGLTADEVAAQLRTRIKVLDNPRVVVKVRDYSSHNVIVTGLVFDPGAKVLRREATPLYVVLAEAQVRAEAVSATIMRIGVPAINIDLKDHNSVATLVLPSDVIKVSGPPAEPIAYFYAGGALNSPGQKAFHGGLTLTQAILASGGLTRAAGGKVKVSRQGADGKLLATEYNLRQIEVGKTQDPVLQSGDRIAVAENR